jgi:hypothetical protein
MRRLMNDLLSGRARDARAVTVLDGRHVPKGEAEGDEQIDAEGDGLDSRCDVSWPWQPIGAQVRVQIPTGTPQADVVRLLGKVLRWLEGGHAADHFTPTEHALREASALMLVAGVAGNVTDVARVLAAAALLHVEDEEPRF